MTTTASERIVGPVVPASGDTLIAINFYFEGTDIEVYRGNGTVPLVLNTDYTVQQCSAEDVADGSITLAQGANGTDSYSVFGTAVLERSSDLQFRGDFQSPVINRELNRLWRAMQVVRTVANRAIRLAPNSPNVPLFSFLQTSELNNRALVFSGDGTEIVPGPTVADIEAAVNSRDEAAASAAAAAASAATAQANGASASTDAATAATARDEAVAARDAAQVILDQVLDSLQTSEFSFTAFTYTSGTGEISVSYDLTDEEPVDFFLSASASPPTNQAFTDGTGAIDTFTRTLLAGPGSFQETVTDGLPLPLYLYARIQGSDVIRSVSILPALGTFTTQPTISSGGSGDIITLTEGTFSAAATLEIVEFTLNDVNKAGELSGLSWDSTGEAGGTMALQVRATDAYGRTVLSDRVQQALTDVTISLSNFVYTPPSAGNQGSLDFDINYLHPGASADDLDIVSAYGNSGMVVTAAQLIAGSGGTATNDFGDRTQLASTSAFSGSIPGFSAAATGSTRLAVAVIERNNGGQSAVSYIDVSGVDYTAQGLPTSNIADDSTDVAVGATHILTFSDTPEGSLVLRASTGDTAIETFDLTAETSDGAGTVGVSGNIVTLNPDTLSAGTGYYWDLTGVTDEAGNSITPTPDSTSLNWTTAAGSGVTNLEVINSNTPAATFSSATITPIAGSDRIVEFHVFAAYDGADTPDSTCTLTFGGVSAELIVESTTSATGSYVGAFMIREANIPASGQIVVTPDSGEYQACVVYMVVRTGRNQTTPIANTATDTRADKLGLTIASTTSTQVTIGATLANGATTLPITETTDGTLLASGETGNGSFGEVSYASCEELVGATGLNEHIFSRANGGWSSNDHIIGFESNPV